MSVSFKKEHAPLRTATGWVLTSPALQNMLSDFEQLLPSLNHLGGGVDEEAYADVTLSLLQTAFRTNNKTAEYIIDFNDIFPDMEVDVGMRQQVVVRNENKSGRKKYNKIGWFATELLDSPVNLTNKRVQCGNIRKPHPRSKQPSIFN
jgi:hypothetical protein